jgi:hypothetical protein
MFRLQAVVLGVGLGFGAMAIAHASEPALNLKPGLWEITSQAKTSGETPMAEEYLSKLPPDQRAKLEASMKQMMANQAKPVVRKQCITEKTLREGMHFTDKSDPNCKQTILKQTSSEIQVKVECTGKTKSTMIGHFKASSPKAYAGTMNGKVTENGRTMTIANTMKGKWLGSDCGNVKPIEAPKPGTTMNPN